MRHPEPIAFEKLDDAEHRLISIGSSVSVELFIVILIPVLGKRYQFDLKKRIIVTLRHCLLRHH